MQDFRQRKEQMPKSLTEPDRKSVVLYTDIKRFQGIVQCTHLLLMNDCM